MKTSNTPLYGLILAGGKSTRMGRDKGKLDYHGLPQQEYLHQLASSLCERVFYSIRGDQLTEFNEKPVIVDDCEYKGPFNGILSAHRKNPEAAWMVLACDLPLLNKESLSYLVAQRDFENVATALATKKTRLPEPLVCIWEPHGLLKAKEYLKTAESSCPRKFLIRSNCSLVYPKKDEFLFNANFLEEYQEAKQRLSP